MTTPDRAPLRIAMISDMFYPNVGGLELHIYQLANCLMKRGHKVIVITHHYDGRKGVRYLVNGLKVYYLPHNQIYNQSSLPTVVLSPYHVYFRQVLIRERIQIVHGHGAFATMCLEGIVNGCTLGYKTVFTDHSLFGFADASSIHTNKVLKFTLMDADHVICVSHTSKENTVLRAALDPSDVSVIPNAIDPTRFTPDPSMRDPTKITIVAIGRLTYRKGVDLLLEVIPEICGAYSNVQFIIGGDGPMFVTMEEMRERHHLQDRVRLLGAVPHNDVRKWLCHGDIFINCSLTEAFCIAAVEAVSCGLLTVATKVGGVPEALPETLVKLAEPRGDDLIAKVKEAIHELKGFDPNRAHESVEKMYSWFTVAERTEVVYYRLVQQPSPPLLSRFRRYYTVGGLFAGKIWCLLIALSCLYWIFVSWLQPAEKIQLAPDFPIDKYQAMLREEAQQNNVAKPDDSAKKPPSASTSTTTTTRSTRGKRKDKDKVQKEAD